jgi:hypothetical protein
MPLFDTIAVSAADAVPTIDRLHKEYAETGRYPFLIGGDDDLAQLHDLLQPPDDGGAATLAAAASFDLDAWLTDAHTKRPKSLAKGIDPQSGFVTLVDLLSGELKPQVHIGLIAAASPEAVFASLGFGDWNECPPPHVHVALHRHWRIKYGAIPIAVSPDVVECFVPTPPSESAELLSLAGEHFSYCSDIVEQGFGSRSKLAASLAGAHSWYFWWD